MKTEQMKTEQINTQQNKTSAYNQTPQQSTTLLQANLAIMTAYGLTLHQRQTVQSSLDTGYFIGRVVTQHSNIYTLMTHTGTIPAETSGKYRFQHELDGYFPVIGDFVVYEAVDGGTRGIIRELVARRSKFSRKIAGNETVEQCVATNFDTVFIFNALNKDFNIRKIERYLSIAWDSGGTPVIILSKADLSEDREAQIAAVEASAIGVEVIAISALEGDNLDRLKAYMGPGKTVAFLGASGVGKSTLVNALAGESLLKTNEVRLSDDRGKHTTTHKALITLKDGTMLMDTPGMRELGMWSNEEGITESFQDIEQLAKDCKFSDCTHKKEPGCAIRHAIQSGALQEKRYKNYLHLLREAAFVEAKAKVRQRIETKKMSLNRKG